MSNVIRKEVDSRKNKLEDNISGDRLKIEQKTVILDNYSETTPARTQYTNDIRGTRNHGNKLL
jgi:hypothetical protein